MEISKSAVGRVKGLYALSAQSYERIYGESERERIRQLIDVYAPPQTPEMLRQDPSVLRAAEVILSGWGAPVFTRELLDAAPNLRVVLYGAGTIKAIVTEEFWARGVRISSAWAANAVPVSEYTLACIIFGLKSLWQHAAQTRQTRRFVRLPVAGAFGSTVGLVSLGMVGRKVAERVTSLDVHVIAYDPYVTAEEGVALGVEMVSLEEVFRRSDVVSVHTPWLKETEGLVTGAHLASMKPGATFINSSRGAVIREAEMIEVLRGRPDLWAVLDVTYPEPPAQDSPLYDLPNVFLTPHIAGSVGVECHRQAQYMIEELERFIAGQPLRYELTRERLSIMA
jgi:phosphoglycerate dehydrogenase-like enzyme